MKQLRIILTIVVFASVLVFTDCSRKSSNEILGTGKVLASSSFSYKSIVLKSTGFVLFDNGTAVYMDAELSENVSWTLTIKGLSSGAIRAFSGTSIKIDSTNFMWRGESSNNSFFTVENVEFALKVDGYDSVYKEVVLLSKALDYSGKIKNGIRTTLVDDMEGTAGDTSLFDNAYSDLDRRERDTVKFNRQFSNFGGLKEMDGSLSRNIQGNSCYYFSGIDYNYNTYVVGTNTYSLTALAGKIVSTDPNDVYINTYIYGFGNKNTALNIIVYELDTLKKTDNYPIRWALNYYPTNPVSPNYVYDRFNNDVWQILVPVDWTGWKLVSLKYNQFRKHNTLGHLGNNIFEPNKICGMALELASSPNFVTTEVRVAFDYVTITEGGPFSLTK